jgi:hypothetical protein
MQMAANPPQKKDMSDEPYTFDDLQEHQMVRYRGHIGWVKEYQPKRKGGQSPYIKIKLPNSDKKRDPKMVKSAVNKYLKDRRVLWVDWNHHLRSWDAIDMNN